jgi:hypothetical protein
VFVRVIKVLLCQFMESIEFFDVWVLRKGVQDGDWVEFDFLAQLNLAFLISQAPSFPPLNFSVDHC